MSGQRRAVLKAHVPSSSSSETIILHTSLHSHGTLQEYTFFLSPVSSLIGTVSQNVSNITFADISFEKVTSK